MLKVYKDIFIGVISFLVVYPCDAATSKVGTVVLGHCQPIQEQLKEENRLYIVNEKIDLKGKTITIPKGSSLVFQKKGKLINGNIIGNSTTVLAPKRVILEHVTIDRKGTWRTNISYPEWFGATDKKSFDSKMAIQKAIDVADTCMLSQAYYTSYNTPTGRGDDPRSCAIAVNNKCVKGLPGNILYVDAKCSNTEKTSIFWVGNNVTIDGIKIEFLNEEHSGWTGVQSGVYRIQGGNVTIENTVLRGAMAAWINLEGKPGRKGFVFRGNYVHDCDCGLIIQGNQHNDGEIYDINLLMENNIIEKEKEPHSEFVSFWGSCKVEGIVYYTNITVRNNHFYGGIKGSCIAGHPTRTGLKGVVITENTFYDCGACSFYNADGLVYKKNYVTESTFVERQAKGIRGSYPDLAFYNCKNCNVDNNSCFGLRIENCKDMRIGKLKQTLGLKVDDPYFRQQPICVTNFIGIRAKNSIVTIDELTINPFDDDDAGSDLCRYYVSIIEKSEVTVRNIISTIPIQKSARDFNVGNMEFKIKGNPRGMYIDTTK